MLPQHRLLLLRDVSRRRGDALRQHGIADVEQHAAHRQFFEHVTIEIQVAPEHQAPDGRADGAVVILTAALARKHRPGQRIRVAQYAIDCRLHSLSQRFHADVATDRCPFHHLLVVFGKDLVSTARRVRLSAHRRLDPVTLLPAGSECRGLAVQTEAYEQLLQPSKQLARFLCFAARGLRRRPGGCALHLYQPANLVVGEFAALDVDIDDAAAALQHVDLRLLANFEALEDERRLEPGAIQFRDVHAFRHFGDVDRDLLDAQRNQQLTVTCES